MSPDRDKITVSVVHGREMIMKLQSFVLSVLALALLAACAATPPPVIPVNYGTAVPGGTITRGGTPFQLLGEPVVVGKSIPAVVLYNNNMQPVDLGEARGEITIVSVVPSIDTGVCERQTHLLGEKEGLSPGINRITVSRDLPFAQKRFREAVDFSGVLFLSDFKDGEFGKQTGLLIDQIGLLARAVMVLDRNGVVRYLQVVPEIGNLPDMESAFAFAENLVREG